jgi:[protein-PII] uridylyltransferase
MELIEQRVEIRREGAATELRELGVAEERILAYFDGMPRRYFVSHTPRQIARHAQAAFHIGPDRPVSLAYRAMRGGFTELIVWTRDMHSLYAMVAGTIMSCRINILGSHVYTTRSGLALEVYRVTTPAGGRAEQEQTWQDFEEILGRVLKREVEVADLLTRRRRPRSKARLPNPEPARVSVSNEISEFYTVVDVSADDRIGLLYDLTRTIGDQGLEIYISKAATIRDQVADTFYLKDADGQKLRDPARLEALAGELRRAVEGDGDG